MADIFEIAGRIHSTSQEKVAVTADEVLDGTKKQSQINTETYGHVESIDNALANLSPEQQEALGVAAKANNNEANIGFYVCDTAAGTAAKAITSANYVLTVGGSIKIKFEHANSAASGVTLKVGSAMAKPLYYDGTAVSVNNTWEDNETVEVYYDGTNYYANNVAGGGGDGVFDVSEKYPTSGVEGGNTYTLEGALTVLNTNLPASKKKGGMSIKFVQSSDNKYVQYRLMHPLDNASTATADFTNVANWQGVDAEPVAGSKNLVESGGIKAELDKKVDGRQDSKAFYFTDDNGYIIAKIDKDGVHSVDFKIGEEGESVANALRNIATQISNAVAEEENRAKAVEATKLDAVLSAKAFCFTDNNGYIIFKIDKNGVHAPNLSEDGEVNSDNITIQDKNGYIVAKVDKDGIHSAKDKHAVACMVLSEAYYPTAAPTRDSDGNVTYAQVMFETGITGSISITYTNGNSSSVAVVYGDYNYTITINRDADGNVETVNVQ